MMRCMICGKPRVSLTYISNSTRPPQPNPVYCYGLCVSVIAPPAEFTGYSSLHDALRDLMFSRLVEQEPEEEKPLEWADVERQLDAFMATLNGRES
jgi:hypothetical protein